MSKLKCKCGNVIVDQADDLPYKGEIVADADYEHMWGRIVQLLTEADPEPDFLASLRLRTTRGVYECTSCGRLWIQRHPATNEFALFDPESKRYEGVLQPVAQQAVQPDRA